MSGISHPTPKALHHNTLYSPPHPPSTMSHLHAQMSPAFEEGHALVATLLESLNPAHETALIRNIDSLNTKAAEAMGEVEESMKGTLRALSKHHAHLTASTALPKPTATTETHSARMISMDRAKSMLAKQAGELDETIEGLEAQLAELEGEVEGLRREEEDERVVPPSREQLLLTIFRGLGIEMQKDAMGKFVKCQVRKPNSAEKDIYIQEFADKFSRYYYANVLWDACF
ncbi:uncharacterized protein EV422DRAFT_530791 [Fimicolochytrium jonesii]|uniref:uncharacterized protein n=1 Tax=Fimicolochytrium jonesii TaxID=1396493 RepID=UPI0022FE2B48|nr:uncharacterized protein EV422DRAFT_530791 [Fimicolochytrium jonesii]KAI8820408.1 hypothetical protein EV422DRAFT_530791 [Fimicolochytrium jonesii]